MTTIYPLCFNTHIFESEIGSRETSDGIYLSIGRFGAFMHDDDDTVVVLQLTCGDRTIYAHICGSHSDDESIIYAPSWMCGLLRCTGGEMIELKQCNPSLGTKITIQPHTSGYATLDDPVAALRDAFENYTSIMSGIDIPLTVGGANLIVSIVDTGTVGPVCIRGVELEVEIQTPLDAPEPAAPAASASAAAAAATFEPISAQTPMLPDSFNSLLGPSAVVDTRFPGVGRRLGP
jgi:hypothetical protein